MLCIECMGPSYWCFIALDGEQHPQARNLEEIIVCVEMMGQTSKWLPNEPHVTICGDGDMNI